MLFCEKSLPRFGFGFGFGFGDFLDSDSAESQNHGFGRPLVSNEPNFAKFTKIFQFSM